MTIMKIHNAYYPEVFYDHVLSELSANRKDPCEIIRELISNSYDASASLIHIYPLLQHNGFIFFDNGIGISESEEINGITPYRAFFSIGKSTKTLGEAIGYKCQGSKLCFASRHFSLITRCKQEKYWRSICIDNPKTNLGKSNIGSRKDDDTPWDTLKNLFLKPDTHTDLILKSLNEEFFKKHFSTGSMIVVQGVEIDNFSYFYGTDGPSYDYISEYRVEKDQWSYLRNYIRFNTRHGDVRILRPRQTGFSSSQDKSFKNSHGYNDLCELYLWTKDQLKIVEAGYPYLGEPDQQDKSQINLPPNDEFNHLLTITDHIVCWDMDIPKKDHIIQDTYNYYGYVSHPEDLQGIGYEISNIQSRGGDFHGGRVKVISLKNLITRTFNITETDWETPPPKVVNSKKGNGRRKPSHSF